MKLKEVHIICEFKSEEGLCSLSKRIDLHSCNTSNNGLIKQEGEIVDLV